MWFEENLIYKIFFYLIIFVNILTPSPPFTRRCLYLHVLQTKRFEAINLYENLTQPYKYTLEGVKIFNVSLQLQFLHLISVMIKISA